MASEPSSFLDAPPQPQPTASPGPRTLRHLRTGWKLKSWWTHFRRENSLEIHGIFPNFYRNLAEIMGEIWGNLCFFHRTCWFHHQHHLLSPSILCPPTSATGKTTIAGAIFAGSQGHHLLTLVMLMWGKHDPKMVQQCVVKSRLCFLF